MGLEDLMPVDILDETWLPIYNECIDILHLQTMRLNSILFVLEKIHEFPFDLFVPIPRHFWNLVEGSFIESCVMIIWRVAVDNAYNQGMTIQQLKNEVYKHIRTEDQREAFRSILRLRKFENRLNDIDHKIREVRHNYIAHLDIRKYARPNAEELDHSRLFVNEVMNWRNTINEFVQLLSFGIGRPFVPPEYSPQVQRAKGVDARSDIEQLLDRIARESDMLSRPESPYWSAEKCKYTEEQLSHLNEYRTRFGKCKI